MVVRRKRWVWKGEGFCKQCNEREGGDSPNFCSRECQEVFDAIKQLDQDD